MFVIPKRDLQQPSDLRQADHDPMVAHLPILKGNNCRDPDLQSPAHAMGHMGEAEADRRSDTQSVTVSQEHLLKK